MKFFVLMASHYSNWSRVQDELVIIDEHTDPLRLVGVASSIDDAAMIADHFREFVDPTHLAPGHGPLESIQVYFAPIDNVCTQASSPALCALPLSGDLASEQGYQRILFQATGRRKP